VDVKAAVASVLKQEGTEFLIAYPVNDLIEAAAAAEIRTIIVRQERTGIHMADAVSRVTSGERIGVFAMQFGPGAENSFGGVAQAYGDSSPIVVLPGGHPRRVTNVPPHFNSFLNYQHVTKSAEQLTLADEIWSVMRRAFSQVRNGRPRPVLVEIPDDLLREEVTTPSPYRPSRRLKSAPDPVDVEAVADTLVNAARPVIYAGQGVHYAKAWPQLKALAELLEAPVTTSLQGKSAFPENHPLSLGCAGRAVPRPVSHFLDNSDVIFGIGCSFTATGYGVTMPAGKTIIHSTLDQADINRYVQADLGLVGDADLVLDAVIAAVSERLNGTPRGRRDEVAAEIKQIKEAWLAQWQPLLTSDESPINPYRVIHDLYNTVDVSKTIITHDAGSPRDQLSPFWETIEPLTYLGWGKTTQLGYGLGLAMGAKLVRPDHLCINVWGDAAIGFTGMDFETAVRERIPILSILFNNFSMACEIPLMQVSTQRYDATGISGNYADFAKSMGGYGERVTDPAEIIPAIKRGIERTEQGQPALLEFLTSQEIRVSSYGS
jgi:thiamine pyrophosphate-dependent acetolactate synthase large subunit-like protein